MLFDINDTYTKAKKMKITYLPKIVLVVAAALFLQHNATAADPLPDVPYGDAYNYAIFAHTTITDAGGSSLIISASPGEYDANVGLHDGTSIGLTAAQVPNGTIWAAGTGHDPWLISVRDDIYTAYGAAAGAGIPATIPLQLGGQTLVPGVYTFDPGIVSLTDGILKLKATGVPNPFWIFQAKSALLTAQAGSIVFEDGGAPCDILWLVPSAATIGTYSNFVGTIIAYDSIWIESYATLQGRAWAETGEVTLDHNLITGLPCTYFGETEGTKGTVPDTASTLLLLGSGLAGLLAFRRRFSFPA
jgi:type VI secretion system secreted protein VgrG